MLWSNEKVLTLIDLYRVRPVLWDCRLKEYKDRNKRMEAILEIAVSFGVEKDEIDRKIKNLVCHLSRELKKERDSKKSGAGTVQVYKSKWFCYDSMLFLKNRNRPRRMTDSHMEETFEDKQVTQEETQTHEVEEVLEQSGSTSQTSVKNIKRSLNSKDAKLPSKKSKLTATQETLSIMKEIKERKTNTLKDQYTAFGEQVGMRIRDLPSAHAQKVVKHLISNTLFEAEMGKYDNPISFPNTCSKPPRYFHPSLQT